MAQGPRSVDIFHKWEATPEQVMKTPDTIQQDMFEKLIRLETLKLREAGEDRYHEKGRINVFRAMTRRGVTIIDDK